MRGLDALAVLNLRNGATVSEVAQEIRLPRTTVYRILETFCHAGYVFRDPVDDRYRLTMLVRGLSDGFDDEAWVAQLAKPHLYELSREIGLPVAIGTVSGTAMMLRETADQNSAVSVERYALGFRVPLLTSAPGCIYLAYCSAQQRETLLDILAKSSKDDDRLAKNRVEVQRMLTEVKSQGYASAVRARRASDEAVLAIPILLQDRVLATLSVRFPGATMTVKAAHERFVPRLRECAAQIRGKFSDQQTSVQQESPPEAAA
jgi:IclR family transcriptional regulator, mhp operon transcriptional activator